MSNRLVLVLGLLGVLGVMGCSTESVAPAPREAPVTSTAALCYGGFDDFESAAAANDVGIASLWECDPYWNDDGWGPDEGWTGGGGFGGPSEPAGGSCSLCQTSYTSCMNNAIGCFDVADCRGTFIRCTERLSSCSRPVVHDICRGAE